MQGESAAGPACDQARWLQLLAKVGELAGMLEYDEVLAAVARLSIPELADWCIVDVVEDGKVRRASVALRDPARAALADELRRLPSAASYRGAAREALLSKRSLLVPEYTDHVARKHGWGPAEVALADELQVRSFIVVPLVVRGSVVAISAFVTTAESERRYGQGDLALAEELARRAAGVVENARLYQELKRNEQRFRIALAHTHVAVFEKDRDLRFTWVYNPFLSEEPAKLIGKAHSDLIPGEEAPALDARLRAVLETGEPIREETRVRMGGQTRHFLGHVEPLRGPAGDVVGVTGAYADVTELKRAQEALAEALAFRERMLGILGHDLRNPLSAVRMLSTLLLRRDDLAESAREQVAEIDRAGKRMLGMIETLLDFSESRSNGPLPLSRVPMDFHGVVRAVVEECLAANPGREIAVAVHDDGHGRWDPGRMAQVVSNLIGNALTHGAVEEAVQVCVTSTANELRLVVHNGGTPIPAELMPDIFEPFRRGPRTGDARHARGLGLGLYIAKQIVIAHGGEIEVSSSAEEGTTFTVRVPRDIEAVRDGGATTQSAST